MIERGLSVDHTTISPKRFLQRALANPDNRAPHVFARDKLRSYPAAIRELHGEGELLGKVLPSNTPLRE